MAKAFGIADGDDGHRAAALVRQYFVEGWYPEGRKVAEDALVPSSALLKAMLINSGRDGNVGGYATHKKGKSSCFSATKSAMAHGSHSSQELEKFAPQIHHLIWALEKST